MLWGRGYTQLSLSQSCWAREFRRIVPAPRLRDFFFFNGMSLLASVYFKTARLCKINTGINT